MWCSKFFHEINDVGQPHTVTIPHLTCFFMTSSFTFKTVSTMIWGDISPSHLSTWQFPVCTSKSNSSSFHAKRKGCSILFWGLSKFLFWRDNDSLKGNSSRTYWVDWLTEIKPIHSNNSSTWSSTSFSIEGTKIVSKNTELDTQ